jgi:hypothetical protein
MPEKLVLERWACGCRRWILEQIDDEGGLVDEQVERLEPCHGLSDLHKRTEKAELKEATTLVEHGVDSPEFTQASSRHAELLNEVEKHYDHNRNTLEDIEVVSSE